MAAYKWCSIFLVLLLYSCGKAVPEIKGLNREFWIQDKNACGGQRKNMIAALEAEKDKLLALTEMQVVEVLGKPDQHELYKRNQKFYHYFLTPSPECGQADSTARKLTLRFNAMNLVKEISLE